MNLGLSFAPLVSTHILWAAIAAAAVLALLLFVSRSRGATMRAAGLALIVLALANPSFTREDRDPLSSVAVVVVDKSPSQTFGDRAHQTEEARKAVVERLSRVPGLDVRVVEAGQSDGETDGTRLFTALGATLSDVPADRIAGAIMITDGRVHDVPADAGALGFAAPVHALITGNKNERDRRVALIAAPRFGIVGQTQTHHLSGRRSRRARAQRDRHRAPRRRCGRDAHRAGRHAAARRHPDPARRREHRRDRSLAARRRTDDGQQPRRRHHRRRARQAARAAWCPASRMPASAPGATCSSPTRRSTSCISPFCVRRKSRTARRSTSCR